MSEYLVSTRPQRVRSEIPEVASQSGSKGNALELLMGSN